MKHLCITYHMHRNWGTASRPQNEIAETCIVLPMNDDIADDILEKGADSKYLNAASLGTVYLALSYISQIQDYHYDSFCAAEEVDLMESGYIPVEKENNAQRSCEPEGKSFNPFYDSKFLFKRIGESEARMLVEMYEEDLCQLRDEADNILTQRKRGVPGWGVYNPTLDAVFAVGLTDDPADKREYQLLANHSDETLLEILKEVQGAICRIHSNQGITDAGK